MSTRRQSEAVFKGDAELIICFVFILQPLQYLLCCNLARDLAVILVCTAANGWQETWPANSSSLRTQNTPVLS